ncbi:MAG: bifunctional phosphopantothenoylcysteine decarboxylase/phosphopantothenate--cysteine ligase CoaBC [Spirochaetaceae bacterium]|nr:bifunctional phosphopantothenoylcysteine decarboxylase/phosphopantothenate--cysteine ligase CoaBC [Spirochaetaceae bacterium]
MKNILLGVTGSIAAYKAAEITRLLVKKGISVQVVMTENAGRFISPLTFQTLTKHKVYTEMFEEMFYEDVRHISIAKSADAAIVAPATAGIIGKLASGIADDMLSTVLMAMAHKPALICPAMNTAMWENPIVQENMKKLKTYGYSFVEPKESELACGSSGKGALANVDDIVNAALLLLENSEKQSRKT